MQTVPVLYSLPWKASGFTGIQEHHIFPFMTLANGHVQDPFTVNVLIIVSSCNMNFTRRPPAAVGLV